RLRRKRVLPAHLALGARLLPTPGRLGERGILLRPVWLLTATSAGCPGPAAGPPRAAGSRPAPGRGSLAGREGRGGMTVDPSCRAGTEVRVRPRSGVTSTSG